MSAGQGSPSSLGPRGREARGVGFTLTTPEAPIRKSGYLTKTEAQEAPFLSRGRED
jgi:hypothetical protein